MKCELHLVLVLLVPNVLTVPVDTDTDKAINEIDHGDTGDHKTSTENKGAFESKMTEAVVEPGIVYSNTKQEEHTPLRSQLSWLASPVNQKVQFSPQSLFRERLASLKNALTSLNGQNATSKNLPSGLFQMVGLNDADLFFSNSEPSGILGGNGWFANKGGILGGPGALLSTGSLLTDYPTAYKK